MKWIKRRVLFEAQRHALPDGCIGFAQAPQALVFDDYVRVYFSTRKRQDDGKYLSYVSYVDVDKEMRHVIGTAPAAVIGPGALGCFDEHGIFPMNVVRHDRKVYGFTCGWSRRVSVPVETSIGLAVSLDDGVTFRRLGSGPIMTASIDEPFLVGDPFVMVESDGWYMWYIYGTSWMETSAEEKSPARVYKIAQATSTDGVSWHRNGVPVVADRLDAAECQALPTVIEWDGMYHMYFCYRHATNFRVNRNRSYRLGYAYSVDRRNWTRVDEQGGIDVSASGWDSDMVCYPHIFRCEDRVYLLYNGNEFGRYGFGVAELDGLT